MSTGPGICETCRHTSGYSSCAQCGGGLGYPPPPSTPTVGPCLVCRAKIATEEPPTAPEPIAIVGYSVDPEAPTVVVDGGPIFAELAPLPESWRGALTDCADLLKSIADKDPPAAAGYAMRFRELLTKAEQYGS